MADLFLLVPLPFTRLTSSHSFSFAYPATSQRRLPDLTNCTCYCLLLHPLHFLQSLRKKPVIIYVYLFAYVFSIRRVLREQGHLLFGLSLPVPTTMPGSGSYWEDFCGTNGWKTFWSYPALQHEPYAPPGMAMPGALNCWFSGALGASILLSLQLNFLPPSLPSKCFPWEFKYSPSTKFLILSLAPHNRSLTLSCWDFLKHYVVTCIWRKCFRIIWTNTKRESIYWGVPVRHQAGVTPRLTTFSHVQAARPSPGVRAAQGQKVVLLSKRLQVTPAWSRFHSDSPSKIVRGG